jgi:hypothetical protein
MREPSSDRATGETSIGVNPQGVSCNMIQVNWDFLSRANDVRVERSSDGGRTYQVVQPAAALPSPYLDSRLSYSIGYYYRVHLYRGRTEIGIGQSINPAFTTGPCAKSSGGALLQKQEGTYELLAPHDEVINDYIHETNVIDPQPWQHIHTLPLSQSDVEVGIRAMAAGTSIKATAVTLIQSASGNLEAVARIMPPPEGSPYLVGYELNSSGDWQGPIILIADDGPIDNVTGPVALIETDYQYQNRFELLVPRGAVIDHYIHEQGTILQGFWLHIHTLSSPQDSPQAQITAVSSIQSTAGNLEAIARVTPQPSFLGESSDYLIGYELTSSGDWDGPFPLLTDGNRINNVTGAPALIESNNGVQDRFELLVPRGAVIDHYRHEKETIKGPWQFVDTLRLPANDDRQFTAVWLIQDTAGNLEAGARVKPANADGNLLGYAFDPASGWKGPVPIKANDGPIVANEPAPPKQGGPGREPLAVLVLLLLALIVGVIVGIFSRNRYLASLTNKAIH